MLGIAERGRVKLQHLHLKLSGLGTENELAANADGLLCDFPGQVEFGLGILGNVHKLCSDSGDSRVEAEIC